VISCFTEPRLVQLTKDRLRTDALFPKSAHVVNYTNKYLIVMSPVVKVVQPQGNFESSKVQEFRQHIEDLLASGVEVVLVDLRDVSFMDSSGLGGLVLALKTTTAAGSRLCLCSINEQVRLLFELTGMMDIFEIFSNQDEFHKFVSS